MTRPLPAGSKVFVGLDNGAQACLRVIVGALDSKGDIPHKVFRRSNAVRSDVWMLNSVSFALRDQGSENPSLPDANGRTY
jgi:hypothetical protein